MRSTLGSRWSTVFPYTTLFRSMIDERAHASLKDATQFFNCPIIEYRHRDPIHAAQGVARCGQFARIVLLTDGDRKSTRLNSSHSQTSYSVICLKKNTTRKRSPS